MTCEHEKRVQSKIFSYPSFEHSNLSAHKRLQLQANKKGHQIFQVKNMYFLLSGGTTCAKRIETIICNCMSLTVSFSRKELMHWTILNILMGYHYLLQKIISTYNALSTE